jgi:hypothetical protein
MYNDYYYTLFQHYKSGLNVFCFCSTVNYMWLEMAGS